MRKAIRFLAGGFFLPIVLILTLQTAAPHFIAVHEREFPAPVLQTLPYQLGSWVALGDQSLDKNVTEYLRPDEYLLRDYSNKPSATSVNLFLAYFKSLQNSWGPHSPSICLPGSGWLVQSSRETTIAVDGPAKQIPVNEFVLEKSGQHILVIYWYQNNRRVWSDDSEGKLRLLKDFVRYRRSDISLVRLVMPMRASEVENERKECFNFAKAVFPVLVDRFASSN